MMISSMDLFFSRDCAGGGGPAVDAPRVAFVPLALFDVVVVAACAVGCNVVDGAVDEAAATNGFDVVAGAEDVVPVVAAGSFVELVVLGAALLRLEKILPPIGEEEVPESFVELKVLGAALLRLEKILPPIGAEEVPESFVELIVLGAAFSRLEKILPPIGGEEVPEASFLAPRLANILGAVLGACEESVETNESGVIRPCKLILTKGTK